jgi:hypothetical protein
MKLLISFVLSGAITITTVVLLHLQREKNRVSLPINTAVPFYTSCLTLPTTPSKTGMEKKKLPSRERKEKNGNAC